MIAVTSSIVMIAIMGTLTYYSVPLYRLFCQATGFGGTTQIARSAPGAVVGSLARRTQGNALTSWPSSKDATQPSHAPSTTAQRGNQMGGMTGMMGGGAVPNLKKLEPHERVQTITHCRDTYRVTTADGKIRDFWERNLRFKTDVSEDGPQKGAPAIVAAGTEPTSFSSHLRKSAASSPRSVDPAPDRSRVL
jgi:hypothetical protein